MKKHEKSNPIRVKQIGRYQLINEIGSGGMACVYKAKSEYETVALKVLHPHYVYDDVIKTRFQREAEIGKQLNHPNIIKIHEIISWGKSLALVMEFCDKGNLLSWQSHNVDNLINTAKQILSALSYAHSHGIIHRDIKPQNILRDACGNIKICDFGSAKINNLAGLTASSMFIGTPQYTPPEIFDGILPDPRTDFFALGVMLYELSTGRQFLEANNIVLAFGKHIESIKKPNEINPEIPLWLSDLIMCLIGPLQNRPSDADTILRTLDQKKTFNKPKYKRCFFCHKKIPYEIPICIYCRKQEIIINKYEAEDAESLILWDWAIPSDVYTFQNFIEVFKIFDNKFEAEKLFGCVRLIDNLNKKDCDLLFKTFRDRGIMVIRYPQKKALKYIKREPLINQTQEKKVIIPFFENLLDEQKLKTKVTSDDPLIKSLTEDLIIIGYKVAQKIKETGDKNNCEKIEKIIHVLKNMVFKINTLDSMLDSIDLHGLYSEIKRLERKIEKSQDQDEIQEFISQKTRLTELYTKYQRLEIQRSIIISKVLKSQGMLSSLFYKTKETYKSEVIDNIFEKIEYDIERIQATIPVDIPDRNKYSPPYNSV